MSIESNLQLARKYEWNAMMAKYQNDPNERNRYESMAKMSMIDAGIDYSRNQVNQFNYNNNYSSYRPVRLTTNDVKSPEFIIGTTLGILIFIGINLFVGAFF